MTGRNPPITKEAAEFILKILNRVEGMGYGGMADFECARKEIQDLLASIDAMGVA